MKDVKISKSLQNLLLSKEKIKKVYFDNRGRHYLHAFPAVTNSEGENEIVDWEEAEKAEVFELYGSGKYLKHRIIPGKLNTDKLKEAVSVGDEDTKIVKTLTRDEILSVKTSDEKSILDEIKKSSKEQKAEILESLGITQDILAALKLASGSMEGEARDVKNPPAPPAPPAPAPKK